jgi:hypothetical protein
MVRTAQIEETAPPITRHLPNAPPVIDLLMARALAKDPMHRFASAIELGEAFRTALGLPTTAGWSAQQELAQQAQAISQFGAAESPEHAHVEPEQAERLRTAVLEAYRG